MKNNPYFLIIVLLTLISTFQTTSAQQNSEELSAFKSKAPLNNYDLPTLWRNFALSVCIRETFNENEEISKDAINTMSAYFEFGSGLDIFSHLRELAQEYLTGHPYTKLETGEEIKLLKCIDFYLSDELRDFIAHYLELSQQFDLMLQAVKLNDMNRLGELFEGIELTDKQAVPMMVDLLYYVIDTDNLDAIRSLINMGVNPDIESMCCENVLDYIFLVKTDKTKHLQAMINGGLSVNYKNADHLPLLHRAVHGGTKYVKLLIENGADINAKDIDEKTALDQAIAQKNTDIAIYLIEKKAKIQERTTKVVDAILLQTHKKTKEYRNFMRVKKLMKKNN